MVRLPNSPDDLRVACSGCAVVERVISAGISSETLRKIESGRIVTPVLATFAALAEVLDLLLDELWYKVNLSEGLDLSKRRYDQLLR